jgi:hypothetical protein
MQKWSWVNVFAFGLGFTVCFDLSFGFSRKLRGCLGAGVRRFSRRSSRGRLRFWPVTGEEESDDGEDEDRSGKEVRLVREYVRLSVEDIVVRLEVTVCVPNNSIFRRVLLSVIYASRRVLCNPYPNAALSSKILHSGRHTVTVDANPLLLSFWSTIPLPFTLIWKALATVARL